MKKIYLTTLCLFVLFASTTAQHTPSSRCKPIVLDSSYKHTKWGIEPTDLLYNFAAFTSSFDSEDDDNGDGKSDLWGVPEWVAYEIKKETSPSKGLRRPTWMTDDSLCREKKAPNDATYKVSGTNKMKEVLTDYRYVRGHMCPKDVADRISPQAGYNTHNVLNAVPQLQWQNNGIWKSLESTVTDWADQYDRVWVICGPVFFGKTPSVWLGQDEEVRAAVADAFFKIVIREADTETGVETLAFIIPNIIPKEKKDFSDYLTSIQRVESLTGLSFLTVMDSNAQTTEKSKHHALTLPEKKTVVEAWK